MRPRSLALVFLVTFASAVLFWFVRQSHVATPARPRAAAPPTTAAAPPNPQERPPLHGEHQIVAQILSLGLTPERAKLLFSMVVGPLPGVTVPVGSRDPGDWDGTLAVTYLAKEWDSLTPEQRAAATTLIGGAGPGPGGQRSSSAAYRPLVVPAAFVFTPNSPAFDYQTMADNANHTLSAILKKPLIDFTVDVDYSPPSGTEYAHTTSWKSAKDLVLASCYLLMRNQKFVPLSDTDAKAVVTHEMFHCYQQREAGSPEKVMSAHPWLYEGEATWVMQTVISGASAVIMAEKWAPYLTQPAAHFVTRSYDAVGVYAHMADLAGAAAVWPKLLPMFLMGMGGGQGDIDAFNFLTEGTRITYFDDWGSSYFEVKEKTPWNMPNRRPDDASGPAAQSITVDAETGDALSPAGPYGSELFQLSGPADVVMVSLLTGYGRLHDKEFAIDEALDTSAPLALCVKSGGCKCPDGSAGASLITRPAAPPLSVGINGGETTAQAGVAGESLDKFCKQPDPPIPPGVPPPGGGGGGGGGSPHQPPEQPAPEGHDAGDPHVQTFDGARIEFQKVGEYTLARSTTDDFIVQVRQVPAAFSRGVSGNKAVATRIGGHRVTVTEENGTIVLRLDGSTVTGDPPVLPGGTITRALTAFGTDYTFEWPDGTVLHADQLARYTINVRVVPSPARRGTLEGLLGNDDGKRENDETAVQALADKWLVTQATSLFDYQPGQTAATFVDATFPDAGDPVKDRATAERDCREEGITEAHLLQDCIIDFGVTNGFLFRDLYAHQQAVLAARAALRPAAPGAAETRSVLMAGAITDAKLTPQFTFTAQGGDALYIAQGPDCVDRASDWWNNKPDSVIYFMLYDPSGKPVGFGSPGCEMGRRSLPVTGTYTMKANEAKNQIGAYHIPIHFVRRDRIRAIKYGDLVSGTIEQPGAHDFYTFNGKTGDIIQIAGQGCQLSAGVYLGILQPSQWPQWRSVPQGGASPGPSCGQGSVLKINQDGTYALLVNSADAGSGAYQFVFQGVRQDQR